MASYEAECADQKRASREDALRAEIERLLAWQLAASEQYDASRAEVVVLRQQLTDRDRLLRAAQALHRAWKAEQADARVLRAEVEQLKAAWLADSDKSVEHIAYVNRVNNSSRAEVEALKSLVARRPALDKPTLYENVEYAILMAGRNEDRAVKAEREVEALKRSK